MLLRTIFLVAFIVAAGDTIVYAAAALARATLHSRENAAMRTAFETGIAQAQAAAAGGTLPSPSSTCAYGNGDGCSIAVRTTVSLASPTAQPAAAACPSNSCTVYVQSNSHVAEGRTSYAITATVSSGNGDVLLSRNASVAFRTFAEPPYATLVGSLDATLKAAVSGAGDNGGSTSGGTLIHVEYQRQGSSARTPADVWKTVDERAAQSGSAWDD